MRVPEYVVTTRTNTIYCSASIDHEGVVYMGDEYFYNFIGKQAGIKLTDYVYPSEKEEFETMLKQIKCNETQRFIFSITGVRETYELFDVTATDRGHSIKGVPVIDLQMYSIFSVEDRVIKFSNDINKYRTFMMMFQNYFFDYDVETDCFTVFRYMSIKADALIRSTSQEVHDAILPYMKTPVDQNDFEDFFMRVRKAQGEFELKLHGPDAADLEKTGSYNIKGKVIYKHNKMPIVVGIIKRLDDTEDVFTPYYQLAEGKDSATGLLNKRACYEYTVDTLATSNDDHYMIMIDIDNFKEINDSFGHLFGDEVIGKVAEIISSTVNGRGIVGRFGGDEFYILTNWLKTDEQIRSMLTSMRKRVRDIYDGTVKDLRITLSIGVSKYPDDGKSYGDLFQIADKCLYIAKSKGKNRYIIYDIAKHGVLETKNSHTRYVSSPQEKAEFWAQILPGISAKILREGKKSLPDVLETIRTNFEVDGIRIYSGDQKKAVYICGEYKKVPDLTEFLEDKKMISLFDGNCYRTIGNIDYFKVVDSSFYEKTVACNICASAIFYFYGEKSDVFYFFFDIFNHVGRWSDSDKNNMLTVSKLIAMIMNDPE